MRSRVFVAAIVACVILICVGWVLSSSLRTPRIEIESPRNVDRQAVIFPDYTSVIIPPNVAPMNFCVKEPGQAFVVTMSGPKSEPIRVSSYSPSISLPKNEWRSMLGLNRGEEITTEIAVKDESGQWLNYQPSRSRVAEQEIDRYLVYRKLHKFNTSYTDVGIYQRDLTNFDVEEILHSTSLNTGTRNGCMNCHTFSANSPDTMVIHVRAGDPIMLLIRDGQVTKVDTRTGFNATPAKYISLHPSGKLAAFSESKLEQFYHAVGEWGDVFDVKSDLGLYLFDSNTVTTTDAICTEDRQETYPSWSADGRYLYFCSAPVLPKDRWMDVKYDLMRIGYDPDEQSWGELETVVSAAETGLSITHPRASPDGRFLVFCMSDYGNWPVAQVSSDLYIMDLVTGDYREMEINSDLSESWHSWSSNGWWMVFSSRRHDGALAKPYFTYIDEDGNASKPILLPQQDPAFYESFLMTYNLPEFIASPIPVSQRELVDKIRTGETLKAKLDPKVPPRVPRSSDPDYKPSNI